MIVFAKQDYLCTRLYESYIDSAFDNVQTEHRETLFIVPYMFCYVQQMLTVFYGENVPCATMTSL